ncbi:MAG: hypothetical protein MK135_06865 [Polyangiaceae bacterium]|nr:hypothetical protein [Polyangiaceae bacterium]
MRRFGFSPGGFFRGLFCVLGVVAVAVSVAAFLPALREEDLAVEFLFSGQVWRFAEPKWWYGLALLPLLVFFSLGSLSGFSRLQKLVSLGVRSLFLIALLIALSRPSVREESRALCQVHLIDASASVDDEALGQALGESRELFQQQSGSSDIISQRAFVFGADVVEFDWQTDSTPASQMELSPQALRARLDPSQTNLQAALELTQSIRRPDCQTQLVVFSDGIETVGHASSFLSSYREKNSEAPLQDRLFDAPQVLTRALQSSEALDLAVIDFQVPENLRVGEPFFVHVRVRSNQGSRGQLRLLRNGALESESHLRDLEFTEGEQEEEFRVVIPEAGLSTLVAEVLPEGADRFAENNRFEIVTEVAGPPRVLVMTSEPSASQPLAAILAAQRFDVD